MGEIYELAAAQNSMVIGGDDPDVGIGGYLTGGGHSPLGGQYGLGADNVLEFEVVTPDGAIRILNQCSNSDLFFAFRGVRILRRPRVLHNTDSALSREEAPPSASSYEPP